MAVTMSTRFNRVWILPIVISLATLWLYVLVSSAPPLTTDADGKVVTTHLRFPSNFVQLKALAVLLRHYQEDHWLFTLVLFCSAYIYKQSFSIPGSMFLNVLGGALYGALEGWMLCCALTTLGACNCYLLAKYCCRHLLLRYFKRRIVELTDTVHRNRHQLLYFLLFIRIFPMTPNWFVNMASPIVGVPLHMFCFSVFVGLMPYNFICVEAGNVLGTLSSLDDLFSKATLLKLLFLAFIMLLPSLYKRSRRQRHGFANLDLSSSYIL
ncbi:transmembrane protein 41A-B-like isoform X2 [Amphibalanus amphitrite]|nr:transmembrane protein 41A-B-like isoform X2 [Amphibalanus amphitrite]XP_043219710.1 transmembrane protein 41A-B-like isoform X2 [Amphibalanus amphitrite]XP_043219711.1 transmembrane protein 41A-B-like isoform X2 [Amphibalanus amphitrite]XP_043219712.1 transmembrane protein 41A-B-like isoform X2 [Amphibalanus amphitrite]